MGTTAFNNMAEILEPSPVVLERITYDEGPATLRRLGEEGWDIIVAHSSGYGGARSSRLRPSTRIPGS